MHDTAYRIGGLVMDTYLPLVPARILEIGSLNVNGSLRDHSPRNAEYIGLDFDAGEGVDIVVTGAGDWNVPDAHFDLVIASSVFEHDSAFWRTFLEMCRKTKPGGHIYVSAPSNGAIHRYPRDCWRFYPDSGLALEDWARSEGFDLTMIESFVAGREADNWNDFCAVFRLGPSTNEFNRDFVHAKVPSANALNWRSSLTVNSSNDTEDMRLLHAAREDGNALRDALQALQAEADGLRAKNETLLAEGEGLRAAVRKGDEDIGSIRAELRTLQTESGSLRETLHAVREEAQAAREEERTRFQAEETRLNAVHASEIEARKEHISDLSREVERLKADIQSRAERLDEAVPQREILPADRADEKNTFLAEIDTLTGQKAACEQRLQERFREIAGLTRLIQERDQAIANERARTEWLRQVVSALTKGYSRSFKARLATLLPTYFSYRAQSASLRREGLFDPDEYTAAYPDVSGSKIHPLRHYINHGIREGRVTRQGA